MRDKSKKVKKPWPYIVRIRRMSILMIVAAFILFTFSVWMEFTFSLDSQAANQVRLFGAVSSVIEFLVLGVVGLYAARSEDAFNTTFKFHRSTLAVLAVVNLVAFLGVFVIGGENMREALRVAIFPIVAVVGQLWLIQKERKRLIDARSSSVDEPLESR